MGASAKKPEKTAQEEAQSMRQAAELDKETEENEKRLKAMTRDKLGAKSLLGGGAAETMAGGGKAKTSTAPKSVYGKSMLNKSAKKKKAPVMSEGGR